MTPVSQERRSPGNPGRFIQPIAARWSKIPYNRLHHFVSAGVWDIAPLEAALWLHGNHLAGGPRSFLIFDHTAWPRKRMTSVGVAQKIRLDFGQERQLDFSLSDA